MARKASPAGILCYITERSSLPVNPPRRDREEESFKAQSSFAPLLANIAAAAASGVDWIQIREKDLHPGDCANLVCAALRACSGTLSKVLVNDRLDVALAARAAGVHLGERSLPVAEVRRLLSVCHQQPPAEFLAGVSCHSLASAQSAAAGGAGYIFFGPIFPTPSKAAFGPAQGLRRLAEVCRAVEVPVLAIGGITLENARECRESGAAGIAAIRLFQNAAEISAVVAGLRSLG
ncbi:MAG: thiamine phosphate synthase [Candidatus Acidiferrum sp.]|jgi:thiamine-phosphate pyrophosphorylase